MPAAKAQPHVGPPSMSVSRPGQFNDKFMKATREGFARSQGSGKQRPSSAPVPGRRRGAEERPGAKAKPAASVPGSPAAAGKEMTQIPLLAVMDKLRQLKQATNAAAPEGSASPTAGSPEAFSEAASPKPGVVQAHGDAVCRPSACFSTGQDHDPWSRFAASHETANKTRGLIPAHGWYEVHYTSMRPKTATCDFRRRVIHSPRQRPASAHQLVGRPTEIEEEVLLPIRDAQEDRPASGLHHDYEPMSKALPRPPPGRQAVELSGVADDFLCQDLKASHARPPAWTIVACQAKEKLAAVESAPRPDSAPLRAPSCGVDFDRALPRDRAVIGIGHQTPAAIIDPKDELGVGGRVVEDRSRAKDLAAGLPGSGICFAKQAPREALDSLGEQDEDHGPHEQRARRWPLAAGSTSAPDLHTKLPRGRNAIQGLRTFQQEPIMQRVVGVGLVPDAMLDQATFGKPAPASTRRQPRGADATARQRAHMAKTKSFHRSASASRTAVQRVANNCRTSHLRPRRSQSQSSPLLAAT
eukprot:TRINITY_DN51587_c0_g1_i1.p1 TRINITY_DN51587_c0_g1~~TRINITY_DN51587_c0_g1_i1.p1  ORF type:complete len:527 (+),score=95.60 TRINITY_DN51587_c0_g1_i1:112-1692(+)